MQSAKRSESWNSRLGVILAVAGSAVGLGNFLRFPGQAVRYGQDDGGGAFMIAYFICFLLLGLPICWVEWTLGRHGGTRGFNSCPGVFGALFKTPATRQRARYLGVIGVVVPVAVYMYYVYIEAWCLGYAVNFLTGNFNLGGEVGPYAEKWGQFVGIENNGIGFGFDFDQVGWYLIAVFAVNFILIYRGLSRGIEWFCKYAMPMLLLLAIVLVVRVLTLGSPLPDKPEQNVLSGLGYMWNINNLSVKLRNPELWLAAAGQIFFSLSVGFGVIVTYASYLKKKDDVVLSGLAASSANEFVEVSLGGMITIPAAFVFLGAAGIVGQGTFALGFQVLPAVFAQMPFGSFFGFAFFFLLFLAAITSSLSMLQPGIAFLEESMGINRRQSCALLGLITALGCVWVVYNSQGLKALDTIDFWVGTFLIYVLATIQVILFGWVLGIERGWKEAHQGAEIRIPNVFKFIIKYVSPTLLLLIFGFWILKDVFGYNPQTKVLKPSAYILDLIGGEGHQASGVAQLSVLIIGLVIAFFALLVAQGKQRWEKMHAEIKEEDL